MLMPTRMASACIYSRRKSLCDWRTCGLTFRRVYGAGQSAEGIWTFNRSGISANDVQVRILARAGATPSFAPGSHAFDAIGSRCKNFGEEIYEEPTNGDGDDKDEQSRTEQSDALEEVAKHRND